METQIKIESKELIKNLVSNFKFKNGLPLDDSLQPDQLARLVTIFSSDIVTSEVINTVISDLTFEAILEAKHFNEGKGTIQKFSDFTGINIDSVTDKVYSLINDLPKNYSFLLRLPKSNVVIPLTKISENIEILSVDDALADKFKPKEEKQIRSALTEVLRIANKSNDGYINIDKGDVLLRINAVGFVGKYGLIKAYIMDPLYSMKVIIGICIALNIIQKTNDNIFWRPPLAYRYYALDTDSNKTVRSFDESSDVQNYLLKMQFTDNSFQPTKLSQLMATSNTPYSDAIEILKKIFLAEKLLNKTTKDESLKFQSILQNAAYWFFETLKTPEEHVQIVYLTTAIESLLGSIDEDKGTDRSSKIEIIASITGKNALEANNIKTTINKLYDLRNKIVHGKKAISILEKYSESSISDYTLIKSILYFSRFFANRINFMTSGIIEKPKTVV